MTDHTTDGHLPGHHLLVELQRSGTAEDLRLVEELAALRRAALAQQPRPGRELLRMFSTAPATVPARSGQGDVVRRALAWTRSAMGLGIVAAALAGTAAVAAVTGSSGEAPADEDTRPPTGAVQPVGPAGGAGDAVAPELEDSAEDPGADGTRDQSRADTEDDDGRDDAQEEVEDDAGPATFREASEADESDEAGSEDSDHSDGESGDEFSADSGDDSTEDLTDENTSAPGDEEGGPDVED